MSISGTPAIQPTRRPHTRLFRRLGTLSAATLLSVVGSVALAGSASAVTQAQAEAAFQSAGITWSSSGGCTDRNNPTCTSFDQLNLATVQGAQTLKSASGCALNITGGTETGHAGGTYSHGTATSSTYAQVDLPDLLHPRHLHLHRAPRRRRPDVPVRPPATSTPTRATTGTSPTTTAAADGPGWHLRPGRRPSWVASLRATVLMSASQTSSGTGGSISSHSAAMLPMMCGSRAVRAMNQTWRCEPPSPQRLTCTRAMFGRCDMIRHSHVAIRPYSPASLSSMSGKSRWSLLRSISTSGSPRASRTG